MTKIPKAESKTVEFKTAFNQDAIVSLVAFANTDGGSVYVGVRDDGRIAGVQLADESETSWVNEIKSKTAPAIVPETDRIVVKGKTVVRLHIASLPVKPTSVQGRYYLRKGKANHLMSIAELSDMYLKSMSASWDALASDWTLEDISLEKVAAFAKRMNPGNPDDPMRVLRKLSLVKDGRPTNACFLAFAKEDHSAAVFQAGRFKGGSIILDSRTFRGDLFGELDGVMEFVQKHLMAGLVITGKPEHEIKHDYPVDAIREIILNMLVHRDYRDPGGVNTIKIFDDRIEFTNPGGLPGGLTVDDLLSDRYATKTRNPEIAGLFSYAGLVERYGSGIKRIVESCKTHGHVDVEFEDLGSWFRVVLLKTGDGNFVKPYEVIESSQKSSQESALKEETPQKSSQKGSQKSALKEETLQKSSQESALKEEMPQKSSQKGSQKSALKEKTPQKTLQKSALKEEMPQKTPQKSDLKSSLKEEMPQKTPQKILFVIRNNPSIGTQAMADLIGVERSTVARAIAKLKVSGRLRRVGPDKGGHWEVLEGGR